MTMVTVSPPWWKGARGEWLVVIQVVLMATVVLGPRTFTGAPAFPFSAACRVAGGVLMILGLLLFAPAIVSLGARRITPLPYPREGITLVDTGAYGIVRHPMYGGGVIFAFGWALFVHGWLTLAYAAALFVFVDFKSRREERWLVERFPAYPDYRRRVRRLVPFIY